GERQESLGLRRNTDRRMKGKYASTQGVASGRYSLCSWVAVKKATPVAGKRASRVSAQHHARCETFLPDCKARFTARKSPNSNAMRMAAVRSPQGLIDEPKRKIRTALRSAKNNTNTTTPRIHFFSLFSSAWRNAGEWSVICS